MGDTQLTHEVVTRRGIDSFKNTHWKEREIAPGALLERTSDGEKTYGGADGHKQGSRSDGHAESLRVDGALGGKVAIRSDRL